MYWKTFGWKSQKVGQKGEIINKTSYKCGFCKDRGRERGGNLPCLICGGKAVVAR